jgi:hypothetical protein
MKNSITIKFTASEWSRLKQAAKFEDSTEMSWAKECLMSCVEACEVDYITFEGEVIGDRLEFNHLLDDDDGDVLV